MNYWLHRISHNSEVSYPLLEKNILTIGFSDFANKDFIANMFKKNNKQYFEDEFIKKWGEGDHRTRHNLWQFITEFNTKDWIIVPFSDTFDIYEIVSSKPALISDINLTDFKNWLGEGYKIKDGLLYYNDKLVELGFYWEVKAIAQNISRNKYVSGNLYSKLRNLYTNAKITDVEQDIKKALSDFNNDKNNFEANKNITKQEDIFFTKIKIKNIRHIKDINIPLSSNERKHLIFTGKNGSGKTSVLERLKDYLSCLFNYDLPDYFPYISDPAKELDIIEDELLNSKIYRETLKIHNDAQELYESTLKKVDNNEITLEEAQNILEIHRNKMTLEIKQKNIDNHLTEDLQEKTRKRAKLHGQSFEVTDSGKSFRYDKNVIELLDQIIARFNILPSKQISQGKFIISYFGAKRSGELLNIPKGINKFEQPQMYNISDKSNKDFIQFLVNMKADRSFAKDDNNYEIVKQIDEWFESFENLLQEIFEDENINLKFDFANYNFNIIQTKRQPFDFSTLSDGYSAIFNIVTELMMRMENHKAKLYDLQGIVLIDEIETHLHVELQKKILPFLIKFFPNIQFIITTHSPFVLSSISNAVIYDLEKNIREEDFSAYSYDGIVETYLESNKYSDITKTKLNRYRELLLSKDITDLETNELRTLEYYFENIPSYVAPELIYVYQSLKIQKLNING